MGFFSFKTQDSDRSIPSEYSDRSTFTVTMTDDKGNKWTEPKYEGYGVFGGKDYYELLAEMNGKTDRNDGINLANPNVHGEAISKGIKFPNLTEDANHIWIDTEPKECEHQGFFYPEENEEY
jgi:hypothetical protein